MIKIPVKEGESIERALKRLKRKTDSTGIIKEVRKRKQFVKPSVFKRQQLIKARYVEQLKREENE
ncbi:MAG: 30S ribosomal protein S21 [Bacteroidetes bacterium]|nr:MAG: 30S ribosomal protein S21 [Bacteroidota bacterium]